MSDYLRHPLDGCFARVGRADEHLADLKIRLNAVFEQQAHSIGIEYDPNPPHKDIILAQPTETFFGMSIAIRIGEICYNLRSALDYLVFELATLDSGCEQSGTQFPIEGSPEGFVGRRKTYLKGVNDAHVARIEQLQPYKRCQWTKNLRDASNPDKHRHFVKAGGSFTATIHSSLDTDLDRVIGHARMVMHPVHGPVKMKVHMIGSITFADGTPIVETFEEIKAEVSNILVAFKPEFQRN